MFTNLDSTTYSVMKAERLLAELDNALASNRLSKKDSERLLRASKNVLEELRDHVESYRQELIAQRIKDLA